MQTLASLYSAVTGIGATAADLKTASNRMWNAWRDLNASAGFTSKDDQPPDIWFKPLKGPAQEYRLYDYFLKRELSRGDAKNYLDEYYDERARN
jgi:aldehyde:ferredoxin oxidoreductase